MDIAVPFALLAAGFLAAALLSYGLTYALLPTLRRVALSRPGARSSHREPTPQGGGIAVVVAAIVACAAVAALARLPPPVVSQLFILGAAAAFVAAIGFIDDIKSLPVSVRLAAQIVAAAGALTALPDAIVPALPYWIERALLLAALLWFINLTNFMDGIDWMTIAGIVPPAAGLVLIGSIGVLPNYATLIAAVLLGAMLGFAPLNKPVARVFLGDAGSLPIGLITGVLLIALAQRGHIAAAILLPLYYLADATITLLRRLVRGEPIWKAHRDHFYQRALDGGADIWTILVRVFATNAALAVLAVASVRAMSRPVSLAALVLGALLVALLLWSLDRRRA